MAVKEKINDELKEEKNGKIEKMYSKEQLMSSKKFAGRRDILNALLTEDRQYTIAEAEKMIDNYMKGTVR